MPLHESEASQRVYGGLSRAILALVPVGPLAPVTGSEAQIAAGLAVYRNNVRAAYLRVLADAFPVVQRLVGEEFFRYLAHEYFHAQPPRSPIVARYGDALPDFLGRFEPVAHLPYLADVARLEIAWLGAYHAAEDQSLSGEKIFAALGENQDCARFAVHPSMRLISSSFPVHTIWLHNRNEDPAPLRLGVAGERVLLIRPARKVEASAISHGLHAALQAISDGAHLGEAMDRVLESEPNADLSDIISGIATSGAVTAVSTDTELMEGL